MKINKMKLLVTGGAGFIGSHLCEALLKQNHKVICLDNFHNFYDPKIKERNIKKCLKNKNFTLYRADILDKKALAKIFQKEQPEKIIHLAARAGVRPSMQNPDAYLQVNVQGTLNLLELAKKHKLKQFILGSSSSVYGIRNKSKFSENDKTDFPVSVYGATKKSAEVLCHAYATTYKIPTTCLRFFTVYGQRQRPDLAIHKFTKLITNNRPIPVYGSLETMRDYTFIDDIIAGTLKALEKEFDYEIINLGNNNPVKLKDLIKLLEKTINKQAILNHLPPQPGDVPITYADIRKAKKLLNWKPKTKIKKGIEEFIAWYKANN